MPRLLKYSLLAFILAACGKPASEPPVAAKSDPAKKIADGWKVFEDDWFRVSYPDGSDVGGGGPDGKQDPKFPTLAVVPPTAGGKIHGAFTLQFDKRTSGMLLRDAFQSELEAGLKPRGTLLVPPREIKVANGKCLSAIVNKPFDRCPKDSGNCYKPFIYTLCDDPAGRRFTAMTLLSLCTDAQSLSPQAQQEAATYERILRSLEFKKS